MRRPHSLVETRNPPLGETSPALLVSAPEVAAVHGGAEALPDRHPCSPADLHEGRPEGGGGDTAEVGSADGVRRTLGGAGGTPDGAQPRERSRVAEQGGPARRGLGAHWTERGVQVHAAQGTTLHDAPMHPVPPPAKHVHYAGKVPAGALRYRGGTHAAVAWDCCDDAVDGPAASSTARRVPPPGCTPPEAGGGCGGGHVCRRRGSWRNRCGVCFGEPRGRTPPPRPIWTARCGPCSRRAVAQAGRLFVSLHEGGRCAPRSAGKPADTHCTACSRSHRASSDTWSSASTTRLCWPRSGSAASVCGPRQYPCAELAATQAPCVTGSYERRRAYGDGTALATKSVCGGDSNDAPVRGTVRPKA
ncbi:hypothetical protein GH5_01498 [Leishmania sp. Ghana 2012 LV757]|uniref:hypothetical protein n=1 Tax=Leishmania sp. Ghana 2012 LV757 TaxID=2803181 RepID=UPI001B6412CA|nr:hypothetical protein GH5_01498 [Leishmania sp. Ghana 2012 LV757]